MPPAVYPEVQQYFTPESWARLSVEVEQGLAQGRPYACDAEVVRPDGMHRWIVARGEATRDAAGDIINLHGTVQDITERKRAEAQLRIWAEAFEHADFGLAISDAKSNTFLRVNPAFARERGYIPEQLHGKPIMAVFPADVVEDVRRKIEALDSTSHGVFESVHIGKDGRRFPVLLDVTVIRGADGEPVNRIAYALDITDRQRAEAEIHRLNADLERRVIERTAELSAANHELDAFAYAVSHDLRAPLRAMNGFSQALVEDYSDSLQGEARVYLDQIGIASNRMANLIDGILTLSRSTRNPLQREPVDISAMAKRQLLELAETDPGRQVSWHVAPELTVEGDPRMVEVVMQNLLGNAWKYSARTPLAEIRVYSEQEGGECRICVADNGAGFDMAHAGKLFEPFQRLHRQEEFTGIGIGLATVQRIVHRHGGNIEATGKPNEGARFCFTLGGNNKAGME